MTQLVSPSWGQIDAALGWALLHFLWQGTILAMLLYLFLLRCEAAKRRYGAACLTLILLALCPLLTFLWLLSIPSLESAGVESAGASIGSSVLVLIPGYDLRYLVAFWLAGVFLFSFRLLGGGLALRHLVQQATPTCPVEWQQCAAALAQRLHIRQPVTILHSTQVQTPTIIGCFRAVILLPISALSGLPMQQIEALLAHELAHVRRYDYWVNLCQMVIETLFFYHPAVWWVSQQARLEREVCCDDIVVSVLGDRLSYARALASLAETRSTSHPLALASNGGNLMARIRHIIGLPHIKHGSRTIKSGSVFSLVLLSGAALIWQMHASASPVVAKGQAVRPVSIAPSSIPTKSMHLVSSNPAEGQPGHVEDDKPGQPEDDGK